MLVLFLANGRAASELLRQQNFGASHYDPIAGDNSARGEPSPKDRRLRIQLHPHVMTRAALHVHPGKSVPLHRRRGRDKHARQSLALRRNCPGPERRVRANPIHFRATAACTGMSSQRQPAPLSELAITQWRMLADSHREDQRHSRRPCRVARDLPELYQR